MSKSEYERAWGTAGWLDDHELAGSGETVLCQRKVKVRNVVDRAAARHDGVNVQAVYRKAFEDGSEMCGAFLWGKSDARHPQQKTLSLVSSFLRDFSSTGEVVGVRLTTFLYDVPSGEWRAIVVFRKGEKL